jgi:DNA-binding NarL/FixJ family response regulator
MPLRILIVDDEPLVRLGIRLLMEQHQGWAVCGEAQNGEEAVEKAAKLDPNLVLLDVSMPRMNGLTAAPLIHEKVPQAMIVILTLHDSVEMARQASRVGADAFVSKALVATDLAPTIEALQAAGPGNNSRHGATSA